MAPRATRFQAVPDKPLRLELVAKPKVPSGILRKSARGGEKKRVTFGGVEERVVERWIGIGQVCLPLDSLRLSLIPLDRALSPPINSWSMGSPSRGASCMCTQIPAALRRPTLSDGHVLVVGMSSNTGESSVRALTMAPITTALTPDAIAFFVDGVRRHQSGVGSWRSGGVEVAAGRRTAGTNDNRTYSTTGPLVTGSTFISHAGPSMLCAPSEKRLLPHQKKFKTKTMLKNLRLITPTCYRTALQQLLDTGHWSLDTTLSCRRRKYPTIKREFTSGHRSFFCQRRDTGVWSLEPGYASLLPKKKIFGNQKRLHSWS